MSEKKQAAKGDKVNVVLADGRSVTAEVTAAHKSGLCDLTFEHGGQEVTITGSSCDPDGKMADSWHFPAVTAKGAPPAAAASPATPAATDR